MIRITDDIVLQEDELEERFIRASGPGGQNVNKVSSAVQLRFDAQNSPSLAVEVQGRLKQLAGKRMTADGILVISARRFRTQEQNRADALQRLVELIRTAAEKPIPRKRTKPSAAANRRRLDSKIRRGHTKRLRSRIVLHDEK